MDNQINNFYENFTKNTINSIKIEMIEYELKKEFLSYLPSCLISSNKAKLQEIYKESVFLDDKKRQFYEEIRKQYNKIIELSYISKEMMFSLIEFQLLFESKLKTLIKRNLKVHLKWLNALDEVNCMKRAHYVDKIEDFLMDTHLVASGGLLSVEIDDNFCSKSELNSTNLREILIFDKFFDLESIYIAIIHFIPVDDIISSLLYLLYYKENLKNLMISFSDFDSGSANLNNYYSKVVKLKEEDLNSVCNQIICAIFQYLLDKKNYLISLSLVNRMFSLTKSIKIILTKLEISLLIDCLNLQNLRYLSLCNIYFGLNDDDELETFLFEKLLNNSLEYLILIRTDFDGFALTIDINTRLEEKTNIKLLVLHSNFIYERIYL